MEKYIVEFIGTFALLLTIVLSKGSALAIGGILALNVLIGGKISGGHFNPAVSTAFLVNKKMKRSDFLPYVVSQLAGGILAVMISKNIKKLI